MVFFIFIQIWIVFIVLLTQTVETLIRHRVKVNIVIYRKKWNYFDFNQFDNFIFRILKVQTLT